MVQTLEKPKGKRMPTRKIKAIAREVVEEAMQGKQADETTVKNSNVPVRVPGAVLGQQKQKMPWSMKDLAAKFGTDTFVPDERQWVELNGVGVQLEAGVEVTLPKCFEGIVKDSKRALRIALQTRRTPIQEVGALSEDLED